MANRFRAAIDRYSKQAPINKPGPIVGDYEFKKANDTLNAVCKNLMKEGKVRLAVHKTPIISEKLQKLFESGGLGNVDTKDPKQLQQTAWFYTYLYFGRRGRENNAVSLQRCLSSAKHPRVDDILSCEETFRGWFCRQIKTGHQGGVNDNIDEAEGKMFVNSFPELENDKDFKIKLTLSLT